MVIHSYNKNYVLYVADVLGIMFERAVKSGLNYNIFWNTFVNSNVARQIEKGNPKYLSCSSSDYLKEMYSNFKTNRNLVIHKGEYYWAGWILAQLQYHTGHTFYNINKYFSIEEVLKLYSSLHNSDVKEFFNIARDYFNKREKFSKLKKIRLAYGLTQKELAEMSEVQLRSIQMYEQGRNDINKAQAETLYKLSRVLGCSIEDLMEYY